MVTKKSNSLFPANIIDFIYCLLTLTLPLECFTVFKRSVPYFITLFVLFYFEQEQNQMQLPETMAMIQNFEQVHAIHTSLATGDVKPLLQWCNDQ
jgi:ABC-type arginine transport system permease subunit